MTGCDNLGKKTVLRFAYEKDFVRQEPVGPTLKEALAHLDQLKPFLHKNRDLILVVQAGVIGAWGEWHSSIHGLEHSDTAKIAILEKVVGSGTCREERTSKTSRIQESSER
mgnify:FL=1